MYRTLLITDNEHVAARLQQILGADYVVTATGGQICDLPVDELGVDRASSPPIFRLTARGKATIVRLRTLLKDSAEVILAPAPTREGEALASHLASRLRLKQAWRVRFTELTSNAVRAAIEAKEHIDFNLVHAHYARRATDRLIGYTLSRPLSARLQRKGISTGRLQVAAAAILVERERLQRRRLPVDSYFAELNFDDGGNQWSARWIPPKSRPLGAHRTNATIASALGTAFRDAESARDAATVRRLIVSTSNYRQLTHMPPPPLTTVTLQLQAAARWGYSLDETTASALQLFLAGHITLPLTTQTELRESAIGEIRGWASREGLPLGDRPNRFASPRMPGEAPEAIRPTNFGLDACGNTPSEQNLYALIRHRAIQSQLAPTLYATQELTLTDAAGAGHRYRAVGCQLLEPGYLEYGSRHGVLQSDDPDHITQESPILPDLVRGDEVFAVQGTFDTEPMIVPRRHTPSTLCAQLSDLGIGQPTAYSAVLSTLTSRGYAEVREGYLVPTRLCEAIYDTIYPMFSYTHLRKARETEATFDAIASGHRTYTDAIRATWEQLDSEMARFESAAVIPLPRTEQLRGCPRCGRLMDLAHGPHGSFWSCTGFTADPECDHTEAA